MGFEKNYDYKWEDFHKAFSWKVEDGTRINFQKVIIVQMTLSII